jgi:hypothetical protein
MPLASMLVLLVALTACAKAPAPTPIVVKTNLIAIPADLRKCVETSGVDIPDRALTIAEVERLWKQDRVRIAVLRGCAKRALAFYDAQRKRLSK